MSNQRSEYESESAEPEEGAPSSATADGDRGNTEWRWIIGAIGTVLALAAFFGVHSFKDALVDVAEATGPLFAVGTLGYEGNPHTTTCPPGVAGSRPVAGEWIVCGTFTNRGSSSGTADVTISIHSGEWDDTPVLGSCAVTTPTAASGESVAVSCTITITGPGGGEANSLSATVSTNRK